MKLLKPFHFRVFVIVIFSGLCEWVSDIVNMFFLGLECS